MNLDELRNKSKLPARQAGGQVVKEYFESNRETILAVAPEGFPSKRIIEVALMVLRDNPKLMECSTKSLFGSIVHCASLGLEPNTPQGHAYLVPFNTKGPDGKWTKDVQVIVGYKGLIALARRSGEIESISAQAVYQGDEFDVSLGTDDRIRHVPKMDGDRGEAYAFYAVAKFRGGGYQFEVMSRSQVEAIRDNSKGWQDAVKYNKTGSAPWGKDFIEMARKTVVRRLAKYLPLSIEAASAVELDDMAAEGKPQGMDRVLDGEFSYSEPEGPAPEEPNAPEPYPASEFEKNFPAWAGAIQEGKLTPEQVIQRAEERAPLTDEQRRQIHGVSAGEDNEAFGAFGGGHE